MADLSPGGPTLSLHADPHPGASSGALVARLTHRRFLGEQADVERAEGAARALVERLLPRLRRLEVRASADGVPCGAVWLLEEGDDLGVLELDLDDHRLAHVVRDLVVDLARAEQLRRLTIGVAPGDAVTEAFVRGRRFAVEAFQMRLDLDHSLPDDSAVALTSMSQDAFDTYLSSFVDEYAETREKAGETPERAREVAHSQMASLLPEGLDTREHHFFVGSVGDQVVGTLWVGTERPMAFVYDVAVDEAQRRRGHGAGLMQAAALWSQRRGAHALGLNVFAYNLGAKALYDRLGYHVVEAFAAHTIDLDPLS